VHNPGPGRDGRRGAGARRATVPGAGSWCTLPRIKGPPSTGREISSLDLSQLGLKLPNTSLGTYPQIFMFPIEFLVGYRQWPRSYLGPGPFPGQRSFQKLPGPSRGPGSRGRVAPRPRQALRHWASGGWGCMLERHAQRRCKPCRCKKQNLRNQVFTGFEPRLPDAIRRSRLMSVGVLLPTRLPMRLPRGLVTGGAFDICTRAILSEIFAISHFLFLRF